MDSSLILDGSFTVSLFYNCVAVYDESQRNFDYFANIKSAAAGNAFLIVVITIQCELTYIFHSTFRLVRFLKIQEYILILPDASSILAAKLLEKIYDSG